MGLISKALAQTNWDSLRVGEGGGIFGNANNWQNILQTITNMVFMIAGIIAFFYLIYSGFIYLTAGGNPDAAKKGQQGLLNAILGLVIIFLAYGIVRFVVSFLAGRGR